MMNSLPLVSLNDLKPIPDSLGQYSLDFIETNGAINLGLDNGIVTVGLTDKANYAVIESLRLFHREKVNFVQVDPVELSSYLSGKMGESTDRGIPSNDAENDDRVLLDKLANDAPTINMVNSLCIDGIRAGASDIHIEATTTGAIVRYRIDGVLRTIRKLEIARFPAISSRIKIMANLNILERRQPQDGRITVSIGNENVDFRVSIVPVSGGESIVLRILGKMVDSQSIQDLGFTKSQTTKIRRLLSIPHGLILVTGPTGSGKTTTLNAMLKEILDDSKKIITIEDPVEFIVPGTNQIQVNEQINLGFDVILRRVLRQDPNVIMVGEIRDRPTAEIAIRAALTGHLVLSTLHTNDAVSVIPRLVNMGIEPYLIASVLRGAIAQRLVRKNCPNCAQKNAISAADARALSSAGLKASKTLIGEGCESCGYTGYKGRTVISEVFETDPELEELILTKQHTSLLTKHLCNTGMDTIFVDGMRKVSEGQTTIAEIEREISISEACE